MDCLIILLSKPDNTGYFSFTSSIKALFCALRIATSSLVLLKTAKCTRISTNESISPIRVASLPMSSGIQSRNVPSPVDVVAALTVAAIFGLVDRCSIVVLMAFSGLNE